MDFDGSWSKHHIPTNLYLVLLFQAPQWHTETCQADADAESWIKAGYRIYVLLVKIDKRGRWLLLLIPSIIIYHDMIYDTIRYMISSIIIYHLSSTKRTIVYHHRPHHPPHHLSSVAVADGRPVISSPFIEKSTNQWEFGISDCEQPPASQHLLHVGVATGTADFGLFPWNFVRVMTNMFTKTIGKPWENGGFMGFNGGNTLW